MSLKSHAKKEKNSMPYFQSVVDEMNGLLEYYSHVDPSASSIPPGFGLKQLVIHVSSY